MIRNGIMNKGEGLKDSPKWMLAPKRFLFGTWAIVPFLICTIFTLNFSARIVDHWTIRYCYGQGTWDEGVRLIHLNSRELSNGSFITIPEHSVRVIAHLVISMLAFAFWMYLLTYLNMKLHNKKLRNSSIE